jgi:REP element-mobilizing transposase RayT
VARPIVIAYHLIWTAYGWWLPNDPRGSCSRSIRTNILAQLGDLHQGRKAAQPTSSEIRQFYEAARDWLKYSLHTFDPPAVDIIAEAFAAAVAEQRYTCYACCIMPDHVHMLIRKHRDNAEQMIANLQEASRLRLRETVPWNRTQDHPIWGGHGWKVFLDHPDDIHRTIGYIEQNPVALRRPVQRWAFVSPYDNWPLHPGHSPNSPYVRRLRAAGRYP